MTTLGLVQGYIPGGYKTIKEKDGKPYQIINYAKILGISFLIAAVFSLAFFFFFIYPNYPEL
jgi:hypothetical protein